jgi:hypothetical protein
MRRSTRLVLSCVMVAVALLGPTQGCVDDLVGSSSSSGAKCSTVSCDFGRPCCSGYYCAARIGDVFNVCQKP